MPSRTRTTMPSNQVRTMLETNQEVGVVYFDLDTKKDAQRASERDNASGALRLLIEEGYRHNSDLISVADLEKIAEKLSSRARKDPPWGWRYLRNILNKKIDPSPKIMAAIYALGAEIDGTPRLLATATRVQVYAAGKVSPGAVVLSDSKPCRNPACAIEFVPRSGNQKYCCPECQAWKKKLLRGAGK